MAREFNSPEEAQLAAAWEKEFENEKRNGGGNLLVELLVYSRFWSRREFGKKRKTAILVELVGERGNGRRYTLKNGELPRQLQQFVEWELKTDDYDKVVENLRRVWKR